jgi:TPR repeat protein
MKLKVLVVAGKGNNTAIAVPERGCYLVTMQTAPHIPSSVPTRPAQAPFRRAILLALAALLFPLLTDGAAAQNPNSPVFRNYQPPRLSRPSKYSSAVKQWTVFMLQREANAGDPLAQFELGLRYLYGMGLGTDTLQAARWIAQAAAQNHVPARFNFAIMLYNGWGVEWNPFEAFRHFRYAAERGMPEAQHAMGVMYLNNLVVPRDYLEAARWIVQSAKGDYAPAIEAKKRLVERGYIRDEDTTATGRDTLELGPAAALAEAAQKDESAAGHGGWTPIFLDFERDSISTGVPTRELIGDFISSVDLPAADSLVFASMLDARPHIDSTALIALRQYARYNNPEAVILLGRCYEEGIILPKEPVAAASSYVRAVYLDSPRGAPLLIHMLRTGTLYQRVESEAYGGSAEAQFVWAGLAALELDQRPTENMALDLLKRSSAKGNTHAMVQLGLGYYTGRWVEQDREAAVALWQRASSLHDREGAERLASAVVLGTTQSEDVQEALRLLEEDAAMGSMLAQVALAYSYEKGIGRTPNKGIAAMLYRGCYARGSQNAFRALQRMHNEIRPNEMPFIAR